ncbi:cysteine hydrolase [Kineosporia rhizophila]|uniref:cysteine hydrolase family protein n=1 Tax=Kineosporia rhizophila TaxID=84633 RepID=UPI000AA9A074|nr:cysteine hydrolase [Kineosporia rhizophila]
MKEVDEPLRVRDWTPSGELKPVGTVALVLLDDTGAEALVRACRDQNVPVVFAGRFGAVPVIEARPEEYVVRRHRDSAFFGTELDLILRGYQVQTVLLAGGTSDVTVHYTAVDAHQLDYHFRAVTDLITGSDDELHQAALRAMKYLQRDSLVTLAAVESWLSA